MEGLDAEKKGQKGTGKEQHQERYSLFCYRIDQSSFFTSRIWEKKTEIETEITDEMGFFENCIERHSLRNA